MVTGAYYLAVTYAERLPPIGVGHQPWRYVLLFGLAPAIPLMLVRPFLPESPAWRLQRSVGLARRPSVTDLFRPMFRRTTLVTTILFACTYGLASGVLLQTPRIVPGLPEIHQLPQRDIEQAVGRVQFIGEMGVLAGRLLLAFLVVRVVSQRRLAYGFLLPALVVIPFVFAFAATRSLTLLSYGIFAVAVLINGPVSLLWMYLPRMYPTHLRGTGEGFSHNVGSRMLGTSAAVITTQLSNVMPGASAPARLAYSAAIVAAFLVAVALLAANSLREPASDQLPTWTPEHT